MFKLYYSYTSYLCLHTILYLPLQFHRFVIVENLRYMLSLYDPNTPIYFGSRFKKFNPQGYMSGGDLTIYFVLDYKERERVWN